MAAVYTFEHETPNHKTVCGQVRVPEQGSGPFPVVVVAPGLLGGRSHEEVLEETLLKQRVAVCRYESATAPQVDGGRGFLNTTLSQRAEELGEVVTALFERMIEPKGQIDIRRVGVYGHDFGAAVALERAADDSRIRALCLSSPAATPDPLFDAQAFESWQRGQWALLEDEAGRLFQLSDSVLKDWRQPRPERVLKAMERLTVPVLVLSATKASDEYVQSARRLFFRQSEHARLRALSEADKNFTGAENRLAGAVTDFFGQHFHKVAVLGSGASEERGHDYRPGSGLRGLPQVL